MPITLAFVAVGMLLACGGVRSQPNPTPGPLEIVPAAPPAETCADVPLLTLDQLANGEGANQVVAVDGVPRASIQCTMLHCGNQRCCNRCGGMYVLRDTEQHLVSLVGLGTCKGMDCAIQCTPFGRKPTTGYRFVGRHDYQPAGETTSVYARSDIAVERYCRTN